MSQAKATPKKAKAPPRPQRPPPHELRYLRTSQVASELQVSEDTVRRMIKRGALRVVHVSERIQRVPREALDAFVREEMARYAPTW